MRFYLKLLLLIVVFVCAAQRTLWYALSEVAYDVRVAYVFAFGSPDDMDRLIDDTQRDLAHQSGGLETYLRGKRFQRLLAQRLADAAARGIQLDEHQLARIRDACQLEAFGPPQELIHSRQPSTLPGIHKDDW